MNEAPGSQAFLDNSVRLAQVANPQSEIVHFSENEPLPLDCGETLKPFSIAYQTYGTLNADKSNLVLVCHALTGDQHVANTHPVTGKPGWWDIMVGPGKPIDTNRYFVLCPNVIGGCMGSTGPSSTNPATGRPYGLGFPVITIADMVRAQAKLLDHLGRPAGRGTGQPPAGADHGRGSGCDWSGPARRLRGPSSGPETRCACGGPGPSAGSARAAGSPSRRRRPRRGGPVRRAWQPPSARRGSGWAGCAHRGSWPGARGRR